MLRIPLVAALLALGVLSQDAWAFRTPEKTVEMADEVLHEIMAIPARRIPESLLAEAQAVVIIPSVIKISFVGGIRRGRGVMLVRDAEGEWGLPQFLILTGGSVGWQLGAQATDVVLVFRTKKSVDGLLQGKFTIGVGASAAAGPVGRSAEAATDAQLQAEILSYSRSRGIFAGVALDGSAIEIDEGAHAVFYGTPSAQLPAQVPESALRLVQDVQMLTPPGAGTLAAPAPTALNPDAARQALAHDAEALFALVDPQWQKFLALPSEVFSGSAAPSVASLQAAAQKYDRVAQDAKYQALAQRPEFRAAHTHLHQYLQALEPPASPQLELPPPPEPATPSAAMPSRAKTR